MPTRPNAPDPSRPDGASPAFSGMGTGLDFFQDWFKAASSALPHLSGQSATGTPAWTMPTLDPQELDKRIQELKTVQFWLEQNARMIGMTIQTLEVQRMTLDTLKGMKVPMDALRESLKARMPTQAFTAPPSQAAPEPAPAPDTPSEAPPDADASAAAVNPMQWWSTLTEQFSNLAQQAVQAGQDAVASSVAGKPAEATETTKRKATVSKTATAKRAPSTAARKTRKGAGTGD